METTNECNDLIPAMCGNTMPITMVSCEAEQIIPQVDCIDMKLEAPRCD